jgi:hypothetical protein
MRGGPAARRRGDPPLGSPNAAAEQAAPCSRRDWATVVNSPAVAVIGLFVAGLGVANLYPLAVALSLAAAPGREDQVNSLSQLFGGLLLIGALYCSAAWRTHSGSRRPSRSSRC